METGQNREKVVCVGSGTMGPGVATDYLLAGHAVTLMGRNAGKLEAARRRVETALDFLLNENYLTPDRHAEVRENFSTTLSGNTAPLKEATVVVESISEDLNVKQPFFTALEEICSTGTLFLTNTSGLPVTAIFSCLQHPERGMGTHYWNPPYLMPLVELTPGEKSDPALVEQVSRMLVGMGKIPIRVRREIPGLIWNRLQFALLRECLHLIEQGVASAEELDLVIEKGLARRASFLGLLRVADLGGGDVFFGIARYLFATLADDKEPPPFWREMIERGEYGLKSGQGFYEWTPEKARALIEARDRFLLSKLKEDHEGA